MRQTLYVIFENPPQSPEQGFPEGHPDLGHQRPEQALDAISTSGSFGGRPTRGAWVIEADEQNSVHATWGLIPIPIDLRCTASTRRLRRE